MAQSLSDSAREIFAALLERLPSVYAADPTVHLSRALGVDLARSPWASYAQFQVTEAFTPAPGDTYRLHGDDARLVISRHSDYGRHSDLAIAYREGDVVAEAEQVTIRGCTFHTTEGYFNLDAIRQELINVTGITDLAEHMHFTECVFNCGAHTPPTPEAHDKGIALLKEWLSPEQLAQYEKNGDFDVVGCDTGRRYRIRPGTSHNVYELDDAGQAVASLCFAPAGWLVVGDVMLAQKLSLEAREKETLRIANRHDLSPRINRIEHATGRHADWNINGVASLFDSRPVVLASDEAANDDRVDAFAFNYLHPIRGVEAHCIIADDVG